MQAEKTPPVIPTNEMQQPATKRNFMLHVPYRNHKNAVFNLLLDLFATLCIIGVALWQGGQVPNPYAGAGIGVFVALLWGLVFVQLGTYDTQRNYSVMREAYLTTFGVLLASLAFAGTLTIFGLSLSPLSLVAIIVTDLICLLGWRIATYASNYSTASTTAPRRVLIVGANEMGEDVMAVLKRTNWQDTTVCGFMDPDISSGSYNGVPVLGNLDDVTEVVDRANISEVVVALPHVMRHQIDDVLVRLQSAPVQVRLVLGHADQSLHRAHISQIENYAFVDLRTPALTTTQYIAKRLFDIAISSFALTLAFPTMLMVGIAIRLDSEGPIFFKQNRVGENGKFFSMLKFRSMVVNAEALQDTVTQRDKSGNIIHKTIDDPRVTRIGRIIRKTSLDELPQLINVLRGDMSIVGPRPELPWLVAQYEPWQRKRFAVPQGITGWWQVNGRSEKPMHLNTDQDLYYIENYSFWLDILIILKTVPALLKGKGAF